MDPGWEQEALCCVCIDLFEDPVILDCGHNLCKKCALQMVDDVKHNLQCPQCRKVTKLENGVEGLKQNFTLRNIVDNLKKQKADKVLAVCGNCEGGDVAYDCEDCGFPLCEQCKSTQHSKGGYKNHTLHPFSSQATRKVKAKPCPTHHKDLDLYDTKEDVLLCVYCLQLSKNASGYFQHVVPLAQAVTDTRETLTTSLDNLSAKIKELEEHKKTLSESRQAVHQESNRQVAAINKYFKSLKDLLSAKERVCVENVATAVGESLKEVSACEEVITKSLTQMSTTHEKFSTVVANSSISILKAKQVMLNRLSNLCTTDVTVPDVTLPVPGTLPPSARFDSLVAEIGKPQTPSPRRKLCSNNGNDDFDLDKLFSGLDSLNTPPRQLKQKQKQKQRGSNGSTDAAVDWEVPTVKKPRRANSLSSTLTLRI